MSLLDNISRDTTWKPKLLTVEVGVRGFVANTPRQAFLKLGLQSQKVSALCKKLSSTAAKCSYTIYLAANSKVWDHDRPLLDQHVLSFEKLGTLDWPIQAGDVQLYWSETPSQHWRPSVAMVFKNQFFSSLRLRFCSRLLLLLYFSS